MLGHLRYFIFRRHYRILYGSWFNRASPESTVSEYAGWKYRSLADLEELKAAKKKEAYLRFLDMVEPLEQLAGRDAASKAGKVGNWEKERKKKDMCVCVGWK